MINILYISIEGNTKCFIEKLKKYAIKKNYNNPEYSLINSKEICDADPESKEKEVFFAFVPTYLDGGNGIDNGVKELMTNALGEYISYEKNYKKCLGVIGSGNRNFNEQYCLTARRYAIKFGIPFLDNYELRGTTKDVERIYNLLNKIVNEVK